MRRHTHSKARGQRSVGLFLLFGILGVLAWPWMTVARQVPIVILHTTDVHGHILPTTDYDGNVGVGGLLRAATLIREVRAAEPNVLLLDGGDLYQGSAESFLTRGRIMNTAIAWLGYDAWVVGNHEFDWGVDSLADALSGCSVPALGANIGARPGRPHPLPTIQPFVIKDIDGVRVAVIGLTTPGIPSWSRPHLLGDVIIQSSADALQAVMPKVRAEQPDVIMVLAHQGYRPYGDNFANEINDMAARFPDIHLVIGGHTHQLFEGVRVGDLYYAQAGYHAVWVGRIDLVYDTVEKKLTIRDGRATSIDDRYAPDQDLEAVLRADLDKARRYLEREVGQNRRALSASSDLPGHSEVQQLIARAIADAVPVDVVLHGTLTAESLPEGDITESDLWKIVPYENAIGVISITPRELRLILEENLTMLDSQHFMGVYGIQYELIRASRKEARIGEIRYADGRALHPRKRLRVALNSYVLATGGQRFPQVRRVADRPSSRLEITDIDTRSAVRDYIRKNSPLEITAEPGVQIVRERASR